MQLYFGFWQHFHKNLETVVQAASLYTHLPTTHWHIGSYRRLCTGVGTTAAGAAMAAALFDIKLLNSWSLPIICVMISAVQFHCCSAAITIACVIPELVYNLRQSEGHHWFPLLHELLCRARTYTAVLGRAKPWILIRFCGAHFARATWPIHFSSPSDAPALTCAQTQRLIKRMLILLHFVRQSCPHCSTQLPLSTVLPA